MAIYGVRESDGSFIAFFEFMVNLMSSGCTYKVGQIVLPPNVSFSSMNWIYILCYSADF